MGDGPLNSKLGGAAGDQRAGGGALFVICYTAAALVIVGASIASYGVFGPEARPDWRIVGAVIAFLLLLPIAAAVSLGGRSRPSDGRERRWEEVAAAIREVRDQSSLSDDARRVLNRQRERELLRGAIEEDIAAQDWDAAMILVRELADRFGYRVDAEEFRRRIEDERSETQRRLMDDAVAHLDGLIAGRRWDQAIAEAGRIARIYPDSSRVGGLRQRVESARAAYKEDLERRFLEAASRERIDEAMDLLKELDAYLTEAEAGPFRETARDVIGKARDYLGVQFKQAVQERRWNAAEDVGRRIMDEFPNSRMAVEVRTVLDGVRSRGAAQSP